jgi:hypothetical protein
MKWLTCLSLSLMATTLIHPAFADEAAPAAAPVVAPAAGQVPDTSDNQRAEAKRLFEEGLALARGRDFAAARRAFEQAYQISPHPIVMFNVGRSSEALGDVRAAIVAYESYLRSTDDSAAGAERAERAEAALRVRVLRSGLGPTLPSELATAVQSTVAIEVDCPIPGFTISQQGRPIANTPTKATLRVARGLPLSVTRAGYLSDVKEIPMDGPVSAHRCRAQLDPSVAVPTGQLQLRSGAAKTSFYVDGSLVGATLRLPSGPHLLEASAPGCARVSRIGQLATNEKLTVSLTPIPLGEPNAGMRPTHWMALGVGSLGVAALATSLVLFIENEQRYGEWQSDVAQVNNLSVGDPERNQRATDANNVLIQVHEADAFTWAAAVTGGVLVGTGIVLLALPAGPSSVRVGTSGLRVQGRF